jgi:hypothetical protein
MPENIVIAIPPIANRVRAAFRDFGGRKAGTPLLIASTPVNAVHPEENACRARKTSATPVNPTCSACTR